MDNQITKIIKTTIKDAYLDCLCGTFEITDSECKLQERGGVYGIAIKLAEDEKNQFLAEHNETGIEQWQSIGGQFYPLYWGKDSNLGFRLFDHTKTRPTTATIQLDNRKYLIGKTVIYGAVFCRNIADNEKLMHKKYPDIFKNKK